MSSWEQELRDHFPAYLLPASENLAIPREAAECFLDRLWDKNDSLKLLLAASGISPVAGHVREFADQLQAVASMLPSRTAVVRVENEGHIRGRLDVSATLRKKLAGNPSQVVSRTPERRFDLPENILLVATAHQLIEILSLLEDGGLVVQEEKMGWTMGFRAALSRIRNTLKSTVLREVPKVRIEHFHEQAAKVARHRAYGLALQLREAMRVIDTEDPGVLAQTIAAGALSPLEEETRFEIAVLIRLGRSIERITGCKASRALIEKERSYVFGFNFMDSQIRVHYNKNCFDKNRIGPRDRGIMHYFGDRANLRPDITVEVLRNDKLVRATIIEVKHSEKKEYLKNGYEQALLYSNEYAFALTGWPKVVLIVSGDGIIRGAPRRDDDVIATSWNDWVPDVVLDGLLEGSGISRGCCPQHPSASVR